LEVGFPPENDVGCTAKAVAHRIARMGDMQALQCPSELKRLFSTDCEKVVPPPIFTLAVTSYMNDKQLSIGRISTQYLLLMTSFFVCASTLIKAFSYAIERGLTLPVIIKVGICLSLFSICCIWINKRNYFYDKVQQKHLVSLHLSFLQTILTLAVLLFWVFLRLAFFGSK
jgi:hypothetical protein